MDSKLTLNISRNSVPEVRPKIFPIYIYIPRARDTLISRVRTAGGEPADPDKTSHERHYLIDFARAEVSWRMAQVGLVLPPCPCLPPPFIPQPLPFLPSPQTVRRGCDVDISRCAGDVQRARFGTLRLLYVEGVGMEFRH